MNKDTITYEYGDNLYINVTNQCPNNCEFCLRNNSDGSLYADNLWYHGNEPTKEEMLADIKTRELSKYKEIVFCGYGEPTCRFDDMIWLARNIKAMGNYTTRVNTNGLSDLINKRATAPEISGLIDIVSVSLNADNAEDYDAICHSAYGLEAFPAMIEFTKQAVKYAEKVHMTVVSTMKAEVIENCRHICENLGAEFIVREYIEE